MKKLLFILCVFTAINCSAQYGLGKPEKEIRDNYTPKDLLEKSFINDTTVQLFVSMPGYDHTYFLDKRKDTCVGELIKFTSIEYQQKYMKELNEKWIQKSKLEWKMFLNGNMVVASFNKIRNSKYDGVYFFVKN